MCEPVRPRRVGKPLTMTDKLRRGSWTHWHRFGVDAGAAKRDRTDPAPQLYTQILLRWTLSTCIKSADACALGASTYWRHAYRTQGMEVMGNRRPPASMAAYMDPGPWFNKIAVTLLAGTYRMCVEIRALKWRTYCVSPALVRACRDFFHVLDLTSSHTPVLRSPE